MDLMIMDARIRANSRATALPTIDNKVTADCRVMEKDMSSRGDTMETTGTDWDAIADMDSQKASMVMKSTTVDDDR
jgi:hypothetical protein